MYMITEAFIICISFQNQLNGAESFLQEFTFFFLNIITAKWSLQQVMWAQLATLNTHTDISTETHRVTWIFYQTTTVCIRHQTDMSRSWSASHTNS